MSGRLKALVLGNKKENEVLNNLYEHGWVGITRTSTPESLTLIRHKRVYLIVIDLTFQKFDLLEFVLNVRDFDDSIPFLLIGPVPDDTAIEIILNLPRVFHFEQFNQPAVHKLKEILV